MKKGRVFIANSSRTVESDDITAEHNPYYEVKTRGGKFGYIHLLLVSEVVVMLHHNKKNCLLGIFYDGVSSDQLVKFEVDMTEVNEVHFSKT